MLALGAGACVRTVAAEVTSTSGRSVVASSGAHRYIPRARDSPAGWRAARVIAPLRAAASPRLGIGRASSGTLENPRGGAVIANARAGRSSGSHGSANDPDEPEQEREMLNNVQPSKSPEKKKNRPPAVADQPAKKPSASASDAKEAKAKTEKFELDKKRLELIMEEKEWDLERVGSDPAEKMERLSEYVTAVEAYKSLCATQVPNTVSDLLSQYVRVSTLDPGARGYDEAVAFLNLDFSDDDDRDPEEIEAIRRMAKNFGRGTGDDGAEDEEPGFTPKEVDDIIRLLGEMGELRGSDGDDDDDDDEELSDDEYDVQIEREFLICKSTIWSDPHPDDNFVGVEDSSRGAGGLFGANVTHEFLKKNKLSCLLRSHQCVASGVETCHDGRLFTVFSASNYCGKSGNRGAILRLKRHDKLPQPKYAMTWKSEDCLNVDLRNRVSFHRKKGDKKRALQMAAIQASEYIIEYNKELFDHWSSIDIKGKGRITREQWADGLQTVLKLRSQWKKMFPMLVSANEVITGGLFSMKLKKTQSVDAMEKASSSSFKKVYVKFPEFLARYTPRLKSGCREWQEEVLDELCQALINEAKNLTSAFEKMDVDGSGSIDSNEFTKAIRNIPNLDVLSNAQILSVFNAFDVDDSGTLDLGEFSAMFEDFIEEEGGNMPKVATSAGSPNSRARNNEVSVLWKDRSSKRRAQITNMVSLSRSFNRLLSLKEKEGKGNATKEELQSITSLNKMLSRGKGINDGSDICFKEENVKISDVWNDDIERAISKLFTGYKKELHHLWHTIIAADSEGEHNKETPRRSISNAHFVDLMLSLDDVINGDLNVLTESSAKRLAEHMDTNKDGTIDYDEFIRATEPDIDQLNRYLVEGQRKAGVV